MKKIFKYLIVILFFILSIYYTEQNTNNLNKKTNTKQVVNLMKSKDEFIRFTANDNKKVSILLILNNNYNINNILKIIDDNNIKITVYINKEYIEKNISFLKETNHEIELLIEDNNIFKINKNYLESLISNELNYCYSETENNKVLNLCKKNKMYTIIPSKIIKNNLYKNIKNCINKSSVIAIYPNKYIENELDPTIKYLKKKGYKFYDLNTIFYYEN